MIESAPKTTVGGGEAGTVALLELDDLRVYFPVRKGLIFERKIAEVKAVDGVSFSIRHGETFGLVGESGCGKTTIGRAILKLLEPTDGVIRFEGTDTALFDATETAGFRRRVQAIFQDPYGSLNPRMTVAEIIAEPLIVHRSQASSAERSARVRHLRAVERLGEILRQHGLEDEFTLPAS